MASDKKPAAGKVAKPDAASPTTAPAAGSKAPSDAERAEEKRKAASAENFAKAREVLAAKREAAKDLAKVTGDEMPAPPRVSAEVLQQGSRVMVRFCWLATSGISRVAGYRLRDLTDAELDDGAKEAALLIRRFNSLVFVLSIIGFPLWLMSKVREVAERITAPAPAKPAPAPSHLSAVP